MKKALRGKQAYIDTNIFIYVALKHPDFHRECYSILEALVKGEYIGFGSHLILFELFGSLSKLSYEAAYEAASEYLNLPITLLTPNRETLAYAREIAKLSNTTYDSMHAALVAQNKLDIVITEDLSDWRRILRAWPKLREKLEAKPIAILSPTRGLVTSP